LTTGGRTDEGGASDQSRRPSLRFFHSAALRAQTLKLITSIEQDDDPTLHADSLAALVVALSGAGMDFYFLKPLRQAKVGFMAQQTASLGTGAALRVMAPLIRSILRGASGAQLRTIVRHIRQLMA
jgi:hypothetical protein